MRINITRSIDLEQVPEEVLSLLEEAQAKSGKVLTFVTSLKDSIKDEMSVSRSVKEIEEIRKVLFVIDTCLSESSTLMSGYERMLLNQRALQEPLAAPVPDSEPEAETEEEL